MLTVALVVLYGHLRSTDFLISVMVSNSVCSFGALGTNIPGCLRPTFSYLQHFAPKEKLGQNLAVPYKEKLAVFGDEFNYSMDSMEWDSIPKAKQRTKETIKVSFEACAQLCMWVVETGRW